MNTNSEAGSSLATIVSTSEFANMQSASHGDELHLFLLSHALSLSLPLSLSLSVCCLCAFPVLCAWRASQHPRENLLSEAPNETQPDLKPEDSEAARSGNVGQLQRSPSP